MERFYAASWQSVSAESLWHLWGDENWFTAVECMKLNSAEIFDEWEEFALFSTHYFFLTANVKYNASIARHMLKSEERSDPRIRSLQHTKSRLEPHLCPPRRYASIYESERGIFDFYAGDDGNRRIASTDSFHLPQKSEPVRLPERLSAQARVHFTATPLSQPFECLIVGGRDAPAAPLLDCWLRRSNGHWRRVEDLPIPLYRHAAAFVKDTHGEEGLLIYGGRTSQGQVSANWYLWREQTGWRQIQCSSKGVVARFGANLISHGTRDTGLLLGGMSATGRVLVECHSWHLDTSGNEPCISVESCLESSREASLCRFGASLVSTPSGLYLVGGIQHSGLPPDGYEICRLIMSTNVRHQRSRLLGFSTLSDWNGSELDPPPLLVGHSTIYDGEGLVVLGGGAICFSFGSYLNTNIWRFTPEGKGRDAAWKLMPRESSPPDEERSAKRQKLTILPSNPCSSGYSGDFIPVKRIQANGLHFFQKKIKRGSWKPCVFESVNVGPCVTKWTTEYLKKAVGVQRQVEVHHAQADTMLFESKNFVIQKTSFGDFMDAIVNGEKRYLRSVSAQGPRKPANFSTDFRGLAEDFSLPKELSIPLELVHSSVLRISGDINMWLHYDVGIDSCDEDAGLADKKNR